VERLPADGPVPLFVFDAGYDPEALARELAELDGQQVAVLVRLRSDRCFYADPPPAVGEKVGRPRRHGQKFTCADERTWWTPTNDHCEEHAQYDSVRVRAWADVHTKTHNHPAKGSYRPKAIVRGTLVLVQVERLPRQTRIPKRLWLWWRGPGQPDLAVIWRAYVHRFDLEHTYRFCKQTLNWTTPRVRTPQQADSWTWLVMLAYTQLRLARRTIEDVYLPWEPPQPPDRRMLTAARVRQALPQLLMTLDTPANASKPCGRSPDARKARVPDAHPAFRPRPRTPLSGQAFRGKVACLQKPTHLAAGRRIKPIARARPPRSVS